MLQQTAKGQAYEYEDESERVTIDYSRFIFIKEPNYYTLIVYNSIIALIPLGFIYLFVRYYKCIRRKGYHVATYPMRWPENDIVKIEPRNLTKPEKKIIKTEANILLLLACIGPALLFSGWWKAMGFILLLFAGLAPFTMFAVFMGIYFLAKWNPYKADQIVKDSSPQGN